METTSTIKTTWNLKITSNLQKQTKSTKPNQTYQTKTTINKLKFALSLAELRPSLFPQNNLLPTYLQYLHTNLPSYLPVHWASHYSTPACIYHW